MVCGYALRVMNAVFGDVLFHLPQCSVSLAMLWLSKLSLTRLVHVSSFGAVSAATVPMIAAVRYHDTMVLFTTESALGYLAVTGSEAFGVINHMAATSD